MASYPGSIPNFAESSPANLGDADSTGRTHSQRHDAVEDELEAALTTLGVNPQGTESTVADRLDAIEATVPPGASVVMVYHDGTNWTFEGSTVTDVAGSRAALGLATGGKVILNSGAVVSVTAPPQNWTQTGDVWLYHPDAAI